jgi:hypothetical protein
MTGELNRLSDQLGEVHDLAVLRDLARQRGIDPKAERSLESLIRRRQRKLRKRAISLGTPLYGEKPGHFEARLKRYLRNWS